MTSTKLSSTGRYALIGYGVRTDGEVSDHPADRYFAYLTPRDTVGTPPCFRFVLMIRQTACELVGLSGADGQFNSEAIMCDPEDEVGFIFRIRRPLFKIRNISICRLMWRNFIHFLAVE